MKKEETTKEEKAPDESVKHIEEDVIIDDAGYTESDRTYYDQWDDAGYDEEYGWVDDNKEVSVGDASGETKMDYEDSKKMYAEMDQAYFDAIGCSDCTWDTINWDEVNWDEVDWDAYDEAYNETLEKYGLSSWNATEEPDVVDDVADDTEVELVEGYTW